MRNFDESDLNIDITKSTAKVDVNDCLKNPDVMAFIQKHQLTDDQIKQAKLIFMKYSIELESPTNEGFYPVLQIIDNRVSIGYALTTAEQVKRQFKENIVGSNLSREMASQASIANIATDKPELKHILTSFVDAIATKGTAEKGLYIHGPFRSGKTYAAAAVTHELQAIGIKTYFVYWPDLVSELRSSIEKGNLEEIMEELKNAPILILDDLGAGAPTDWLVDRLSSIINHRLVMKLPTIITSNYNLNELEKNLADVNKAGGAVNSRRIITRIKEMCHEVQT